MKCYHAKNKTNWPDHTGTCPTCTKTFTVAYRFRSQVYCSTRCFSVVLGNSLRNKIQVTCQTCKKQFESIPSKNAKFCSYACHLARCKTRQPPIPTICKNENCKKTFLRNVWRVDQMFCSKSCGTSGIHNGMYGSISHWRGKPAWSHGHTTKTDPRLAALGEKLSPIIKAQFADGTRSHVGENNPMYGHEPHMSSDESKENYSKAAIKRIQSGQAGYYCGNVDRKVGYTFSTKMNAYIYCRSSWEFAAVHCFDEHQDVERFEYEPESIHLDVGMRYLPDYRVWFTDGSNCIVEVKPGPFVLEGRFADRLPLIKKALENENYLILSEIWHDSMVKMYNKEINERIELRVQIDPNEFNENDLNTDEEEEFIHDSVEQHNLDLSA